MHALTQDELLAHVAARCTGTDRALIGIVGPPGAGKTSLAQRLLAANPDRIVVVPMDGFHLANAELRRLERSERKGAPDTFDSAGYVALLRRLRGQPVDEIIYAPQFHREIEEAIAGAIPIFHRQRVVITEGNYLLLETGEWAAIRSLLDEIWYVDVDDGIRRQRLIARHVHFGRSEEAANAWVTRTDDPNAALIASLRSRADGVIR